MREESQVEGTTFSAEIGANVSPNSVLPAFGESAPVAMVSQVPDVASFLRSNPVQDSATSTAPVARALTAPFCFGLHIQCNKHILCLLGSDKPRCWLKGQGQSEAKGIC